MAVRPWMPLYTADYRADTAHLSAAQHGAYLLLIMHYWTTGGLPGNDDALARIACMTPAEWKKNRGVVASFFSPEWKHKRIDAEIAKMVSLADARRGAAQARWENKESKCNANASAKAKQPQMQNGMQNDATHTHTHTQVSEYIKPPSSTLSEYPDKRMGGRKATRPVVDAEFQRFWEVYPKRDGSNPKHPAAQKFAAALKSGIEAAVIIAGAKQYRAWCDAKKVTGTSIVAQALTWINQRRWTDYGPQANGHLPEERPGRPDGMPMGLWNQFGQHWTPQTPPELHPAQWETWKREHAH